MKPLDQQEFYVAVSQARFNVDRTNAIEKVATEAIRARAAENAMATVLAMVEMWLDDRLPHLDRADLEKVLNDYYGTVTL